MKAEFNGNGFKAEINSSFGNAFATETGVSLSWLCKSSFIWGIISSIVALLSLSLCLVGGLGNDVWAAIFNLEAHSLGIWFAIASITLSAIACLFAIFSIVRQSDERKRSGAEGDGLLHSVSRLIPIFSLLVFVASVALNIVFLIN